MLTRIQPPGLPGLYRSRGALWVPAHDVVVPRHRNIVMILDGPAGRRVLAARNLISVAGDVYYAQRAAGESPTPDFNRLFLSTAAWDVDHPEKGSHAGNLASVIAGSEKAPAGSYPKTDDDDADNPSAAGDVVSWLFSYTKADFNATGIQAGAIAAAGTTFGSGTAAILTGFDADDFDPTGAFDKTAADTLKFFVNHDFTGQ